jgi:hypothetical protein
MGVPLFVCLQEIHVWRNHGTAKPDADSEPSGIGGLSTKHQVAERTSAGIRLSKNFAANQPLTRIPASERRSSLLQLLGRRRAWSLDG